VRPRKRPTVQQELIEVNPDGSTVTTVVVRRREPAPSGMLTPPPPMPILQEFGDRLLKRAKKKARHAAGSALQAIGRAWHEMADELSATAERVERGPEVNGPRDQPGGGS
jgi:hypothetical protein